MDKCSQCGGNLLEGRLGANNFVMDNTTTLVKLMDFGINKKVSKVLIVVYCEKCGHVEDWKVRSI